MLLKTVATETCQSMFVCFCVIKPSPVIKVYRYYVAFQTMTNNLRVHPVLLPRNFPQMEKAKPDLTSKLKFGFIWVNKMGDRLVSYSAN